MATPVVYTAIGDSLTFGTGAPPGEGFAEALRREWMKGRFAGRNVELRKFGFVGATAGELLERLRRDAELRRAAAESDVVTLTAGGNDLIRAAMRMYIRGETSSMKPGMRDFMRGYRELLAELAALVRAGSREPGVIIAVNCYNPFPRMRDARLWIGFLNRCIRRYAGEFGDAVRVADAYGAFFGRERRLLAADGIHPNARGHRELAACAARALAGTAAGTAMAPAELWGAAR